MTSLKGDLRSIMGTPFGGVGHAVLIFSRVTRAAFNSDSVVLQLHDRIEMPEEADGKFQVDGLDPGPIRIELEGGTVHNHGWNIDLPDEGVWSLTDLVDAQVDWSPAVIGRAEAAAREARDHADRAEAGADRVGTAEQVGVWASEASASAGTSASAMSGAVTAKNVAQDARDVAEGHANRAEQAAGTAAGETSALVRSEFEGMLSGAEAARDAAGVSETNAAQSGNDAAGYADFAEQYKTAAELARDDAAQSKADAAASASSANTDAGAAAASATSAAQSESGAAAYAQNASDAADRVGTAEQVRVWAEEATESSESASYSAVLAGRSEANAKTSETNAKAHEQAAKDAVTSGIPISLASGDISRVFQADSPSNTRNVLEQDHYGTGYSVDIQNMPGANSAIVVHNYTNEEAVIIDNCDNENALEINNTINLNITPDNIAKGNFLSVAPWDDNYRKRWYLSLTDDLTWRNDTAHPVSFQRVNDVTPDLRPQDNIAFQVKDASGAVTARVFSSGAISTVGNIATSGSITAKGIASKRHIVMNAASGSTEMTSTVSDDGLSYQTLPREIRVRKPVLLTLFWAGDGSIDLSMWNHEGNALSTYDSLPAGGQRHTMLRLAPPSGANATLVPMKQNETVGQLHVYIEETD